MTQPPAPTLRLDLALVQRGLARSRTAARTMIDQGAVHLNGTPARRPAIAVAAGDEIFVTQPQRWVSRAAEKLLGALDDLDPDNTLLPGATVLDAGASTGGFTQVCLA